MWRYVAKRLALFVPTLLLVSLVIFGIIHVLPGDPAVLLAGGAEGLAGASAEKLAAVRQKLGTDQPLHWQYTRWVAGLVRGDLGTSFVYGTPVIDDLRARFPVSLQLAVMAFVVAHLIALPLGCLSAVRRNSMFDYLARVATIAGVSVPYFWLAVLIVYGLVRVFGWLPPLGYQAIWEEPWTNLQQLVFPALALGAADAAFVGRLTRSAMLDVLREDYVRTARAKGLADGSVVWRHAMKNALLPVATVSGWSFGRLMGGTVITEAVFLVPGMGSLLLDGLSRRDFPLVQAIVLLVAVVVLVVNLAVDLVYAWLDPRIRYA